MKNLPRESFISHRSFFENVKDLTYEDKGKLFEAIGYYALDGIVPELPPLLFMAFRFIKSTIDRDKEKYENVVERNRENISKRWNKESTKNTTGITGKFWNSDTDTDTDTEICLPDTDTELKKRKTTVFTPPSLCDIEDYFTQKIKEEGKNLNPEHEAKQFDAHYGSKGWMVGKNKMKDWKKSVSGWINRAQELKTDSTQPAYYIPATPVNY